MKYEICWHYGFSRSLLEVLYLGNGTTSKKAGEYLRRQPASQSFM